MTELFIACVCDTKCRTLLHEEIYQREYQLVAILTLSYKKTGQEKYLSAVNIVIISNID